MQPARASSRDEWAQEAHKLELQGKQEQAQAIRETFLQARPVPWVPWSQAQAEQWSLKALDAANPSAKPRQALFDYALWHGQQSWIEALAAIPFAPARGLLDEGRFIGADSTLPPRYDFPGFERQHELVRRTVGALRQRHLAPYAAKNTKDLLRLADVHGVDHRTPVGATPLMLAARAGNAALAQALLDRGADPALRDEFGQTAWQDALCRELEDPGFATSGLAGLFDTPAPAVVDVQTAGRLVRLERHQGEYWVLMLMVAGLKTQWSSCATRTREVWKYHEGFFADRLNDVLASLPEWLWPQKRRKRGYVNQVLARAEAGSPYRPSRQLWVYEAMHLDWVDRGCGRAE